MPELPEVETTCRGIAPYLLQQTISKVIIRKHQLRTLIDRQLPQQLQNQKILAVTRRAKYILITTTNGTIIIHLGMSGTLRINQNNQEKNKKHDHVDFALNNETILHFNDPRRFGLVEYTTQNIDQHRLICKLGAEPLNTDLKPEYLYQLARKTRAAIKTFLMNQHILVGVGNIYASEALFQAKINPQTITNKITLNQFKKLLDNIRAILTKSIELGGTTLQDFTSPDGSSGYFQQSLFVYGRAGEKCLNCKATIKKIVQCQRSTFYCPGCQR